VLAIDDLGRRAEYSARTSDSFDALCRSRAGDPAERFSVAANGTVIEQAQILTTHNLAALVFGLGLDLDWIALARRAFARADRLAGRLDNDDRPLRTVKDAAYAWRQMMFFLSLVGSAEQAAFLRWTGDQGPSRRLEPALTGLAHVVADGGDPEPLLLGWTVGPHWMLAGVRRL
jgi:hypothetical protein